MRKTFLWGIVLAMFIVLMTRSDDLATLLVTIQAGAWLPLAVAVGFEILKYFSQAFAVSSAFEATGAKRNPIKLLPVVLSAMFVNSLAPSGGTAGTLLYIEDARRDGVSIARSTPAIVLYDVAYFLGFMIIMVIGFTILALTHALNAYYIFAGFLLLLVVAGLSALLVLSKVRPRWVYKGAGWVERKVERLCVSKLHRKAPKEQWAQKLASSFIDAANSITSAPAPALRAVGFMTLTAGLDMLAMIAVGFAFGYHVVPLLVASYVVAQLLTVFSPTPQGVGVVEAALALLLTSFGVGFSEATAIALVYRGYVYWIPFLLGALALRTTKLFTAQAPPTQEQKQRDTARVTSLVIMVMGFASAVFATMPQVPGAWAVITGWLLSGGSFSSTTIVLASIGLVLLARELWGQRRTGWALSLVLLLLVSAVMLSTGNGTRVAVVLLAIAVWLFWQRRAFHVIDSGERRLWQRITPIAFALFVALGYGVLGFNILSGEFEGVGGLGLSLLATLRSYVVFLAPVALVEHGAWFVGTVRLVGALCAVYAVLSIAYSQIAAWVVALVRGRRGNVGSDGGAALGDAGDLEGSERNPGQRGAAAQVPQGDSSPDAAGGANSDSALGDALGGADDSAPVGTYAADDHSLPAAGGQVELHLVAVANDRKAVRAGAAAAPDGVHADAAAPQLHSIVGGRGDARRDDAPRREGAARR